MLDQQTGGGKKPQKKTCSTGFCTRRPEELLEKASRSMSRLYACPEFTGSLQESSFSLIFSALKDSLESIAEGTHFLRLAQGRIETLLKIVVFMQ